MDLTNDTYKVGGYIRLSKEDIEKIKKGLSESVSVIYQRKIISEYAKEHNLNIIDFYVDDGYSGGNYDRPNFKRLIKDIEAKKINCVITKDTSRLGRDFIDTGNYIFRYFPENNIRYIAILDNYDSLNPNGAEDIIPFKTVVNHIGLRDTGRKIRNTRHQLMKDGMYVGSTIPYGYKRSEKDSKKFVIDEYSANIVKRIFEMRKNGTSPGMIARALTNDGILPPDIYRGKKLKETTVTTNLWKDCTVKHILENEVYIGTLIQHKFERINMREKKKRLLPRSEWIVKENNHEPIIDKKLFWEVNKKVNKESNIDTRNGKYDYLLKGLVKCAECGSTMYIRRIKDKKKSGEEIRSIYCCRNYIKYRNNVCSMHYYREDELNEEVIKQVKNLLLEYSDNKELGKKYDETIKKSNCLENYQKDLNINQKKLENVDKALSELYKDKATGIITLEEFTTIKKNLEQDKNKITENINNLNIMVGNSKNNLLDKNNKEKMINNFLKAKKPNKAMFEELINKITISEDKTVKIYFKVNLNGSDKLCQETN